MRSIDELRIGGLTNSIIRNPTIRQRAESIATVMRIKLVHSGIELK
jgi:hypothetical protein